MYNAESPTPVYVYRKHSWQRTTKSLEANEGCIQYTSWGVPVALFLTTLLELPDSYCVKTKAYSYALYVYMSAQPLPIGGFRYGYRLYKSNTFTLKTTLFGWKSMILRSDLTLLNINMSKNSTFAWFFLLKSLYYQWLLVSLHRQFPPSLSTMLKCVGLFCIYTFTLKIR